MSDERDAKLGRLLLEGSPPERDPMFRIRVLERRERQRYASRSRSLRVIAAIVVLIHLLALALAPSALVAGISALLCLAVLAAGALSWRAAARVLRALHDD
jgi:hypothetical protein